MRQLASRGKGPGAIIGSIVLLCVGMVGCSEFPHQSSPVIQGTLGGQERSATMQLYRQQAEAARAEAEAYERRAESLGEYTDTKGFVRSGLTTAAQAHRAKAVNLEELAAIHAEQPNTANR